MGRLNVNQQQRRQSKNDDDEKKEVASVDDLFDARLSFIAGAQMI